MIRIALADDHAILRKGVAELLSNFDNMNVNIEASNGKDLLQKLAGTSDMPHVCILDINMPEMNGYETAAHIKVAYPDMKILALSMYDGEANIIKMLKNGANGYILKDNDPDELRKAIEQVYNSGYYYSELVTGRMLHLIDKEKHKSNELTEREQAFIKLCCSELTYKEIADEMNLSPRTIDGYRESLFEKLSITSRTGLVIYAIKNGYFSI